MFSQACVILFTGGVVYPGCVSVHGLGGGGLSRKGGGLSIGGVVIVCPWRGPPIFHK